MLWVMFNQEGQKLYAVDTGNLAHAGTNDYEIYAVFQEVDLRVYNGASLKLYRPDINNSSYPPLAMTPHTDTGDGIVYDGPENPFFMRNFKYQGFYFSFTSPSTILLDMAGLWRAVITLYSAANPTLRNVVGKLAFNVGNGRDSAEPHEIDVDEILEDIYAEFTAKLDKNSADYVKALDSQTDYSWSSGLYHVNDLIYIKDEETFYFVNESYELELSDIGSGGGGDMSAYERKSNKVTTLSNESTDTQYPSAKCVWDNLVNVREVAEGKCKAFVLSYADDIAFVKTQVTLSESASRKFYVWNATTQQYEDKTAEVLNGDYDSYTIVNNLFNDQNSQLVTNTNQYLIFRNPANSINAQNFPSIGFYMISMASTGLGSQIKTGDVFYVMENDVPDRWYSGKYTYTYIFFALDGKTDLSGYVNLTTNQTISGIKTFSNSVKFTDNWTLSTSYHESMSGSHQYKLSLESFTIEKAYNSIESIGNFSLYLNKNDLSGTITANLGNASNMWDDLYLSGNLTDGTYTIAIADIQRKLTFDTTPTENSTNPVTSGGVRAYVLANQNTLPLFKHTITFVLSGTSPASERTRTLTFLSTVSAAFSFNGTSTSEEMGPDLVIEPKYTTPTSLIGFPNLAIKVKRASDGTSLTKTKYIVYFLYVSSGDVHSNTETFAESNGDTMNDVVTPIQLS